MCTKGVILEQLVDSAICTVIGCFHGDPVIVNGNSQSHCRLQLVESAKCLRIILAKFLFLFQPGLQRIFGIRPVFTILFNSDAVFCKIPKLH